MLEACSHASIMQSLYDMVVQGLNPRKQQGYFIPYGSQLTFQKSYMGHKALAKRVDPRIWDIVSEVIWEGDEFEYQIDRGRKVITKHVQKLDNVDSKQIKGAYAQAIDHQGRVMSTVIMTWEQIKQAWKQSRMNPFDQNGNIKKDSTHYKFMSDMAAKTPLGKLSRHIVNTSTDNHLFREAVQRDEQIADEWEAEQEVEASENFQEVDFQGGGEIPAESVVDQAPQSEESESDEPSAGTEQQGGNESQDPVPPEESGDHVPDPGF